MLVPTPRSSLHICALPIVGVDTDAATPVPAPGAVGVLGEDAVSTGVVLAAVGHRNADYLGVGSGKEHSLERGRKVVNGRAASRGTLHFPWGTSASHPCLWKDKL